MLESMEGRRGMPRLKPPFPSQVGYLGRPTLISNVETLAHVPAILRLGGEAWARSASPACGSGRSPAPSRSRAATRRRTGSSLRDLIDDYAGGLTGEPGAIVPGGAASGILPPDALDTPLTREALARVGLRRRLGRRAGLPGLVPAAAPARRDDALLRRGVVPEVHAVPDRQPRAPRRLRRGADDGAGATGDEWLEAMELTSICGLGQAAPDPGADRARALAGGVREDARMIEFTLDGRPATASEGELLVHAAARNGVFIPTLCHDDKLAPYGGCRMCVVGVEGAPRPLPACATRVTAGMVVSTNSNVPQLRKTLTEMLLAEHLNADPGGRPNELTDLARGARRRGAVHPPRREARAVRRPQPADGLRAGHVHPLQPLRPLHAGGDAVLGALARGARARGAHRPDLGQELARHRVRALRRLPLHLPDGRDLREVPRGRRRRGARARADEDDLHVLRRRLPARPERRPGDEADRQGDLEAGVRLERGQPLRQGPLRLQLRPPPRPPDRAARARRGRRAARDDLGARAPGRRRRPEGGDGTPFAAGRRRARLRAPDERGELPDPEARPDGAARRTPSTRAKPPDTLRPFTAWSGRSAEAQPPTRSRRSRTAASCS